MKSSEKDSLLGIQELSENSSLMAEVEAVVDHILTDRRLALTTVISNEAQKETLIAYGVEVLRTRMIELGLDPDQTNEQGERLCEVLSKDSVSAVLSAVLATVLSLAQPTPQ